jgi:putative colanic acid biosynthesis UDP-glucose lipid carrier transferase
LVEVMVRSGVARPAASVSKRALDILGALALLVFFAPISIVLIAAIRLSRRGPVFSREDSVGLNGAPFSRWRLHDAAEQAGVFDAWVWRSGLEALPSAMNVIAGEMSLIGPEPHSRERSAHLIKHHADYARRFETRPGMICPRILSCEPSLSDDLDYVSSWTPLLDLKLAGLCVAHFLFRGEQGVS